jgi:16S rRNA (adenine(1408)-N(1))-methyltransferase
VHVDIGTGDGGYVLRTARANPRTLVIGVDANADGMRERSRRAAAKPARGGVSNAIFARASIEALPDALDDLAARVTILFPWGTLLRAVWAPDLERLRGLRRICRADATVDVVVACSTRDASAFVGFDPEPSERLLDGWRAAGFSPRVVETNAETWETAWSRRLAFDPSRRFFAIRC